MPTPLHVKIRYHLVCNGCQMMSTLAELFRGRFVGFHALMRNRSERFEARFSLVKVTDSPSLLLQRYGGATDDQIAVSHGEGFPAISRGRCN